jgi:outer membrane lipoprotein carrier protein
MSNLLRIVAALAAGAALLAPLAQAGDPAAPPAPRAAAVTPAPTPLDRYLEHLKTLRVSFLQTIADAHGTEVGRSSGTLIVERPGKFRWDIHPDRQADQGSPPEGGQLMVADGRNLWYYDRDLQQVTVRPLDAALSATPAMLLSGTVDVRKHFTESLAGHRDGLDWVYVEPRSAAADFRSALFGFDARGTLERMILEDKLGQTVTILFKHVELDVPVPAKTFTFTPPPGADVIGTPAK